MKKFFTLMVTMMFCLTMMMPAYASFLPLPQTGPEKLDFVEKYLYGTEQTGALLTRLNSVEADVFGKVSLETAVLPRIDALYNCVAGKSSDGTLSFSAKLNSVDWQLSDRMSTEPAKTRIENIETTLTGKSQTGKSLIDRLDALMAAAFASGSVTGANSVIPKDALLKVKFLQDINSRSNHEGDVIDFVVAENYYVGNALVLPKGAKGYGNIKKIVPPRSFGRDARIDLIFSHVVAIDGTIVPVYVGELAKQEAKTAAGAAAASIGGMIILGPVGVIGGAFVNGQSVTIPSGSYTFVQNRDRIIVKGVIQQGAAINGVQAVAPSPADSNKEE